MEADMDSVYFSPVSIDLGATSTGVYYLQYKEGDIENPDIKSSEVIIVPDEKKLKLSQVDRRQKRHQRRGYKRRKMAKRLLDVILREKYGIDIRKENKAIKEFISGLMNRRGFTFLAGDELDSEHLNNASPHWFSELIPEITENIPINQQLDMMSSNMEKIRRLYSNDVFSMSKKELKGKLKSMFPEDSLHRNKMEKTLMEIKKFLEICIDSNDKGIKHRTRYFSDILHDMHNHQEFNEFLYKHKMTMTDFYRLVGHISNLQLRILRKYFNDEKMLTGDYWDEDRFFKLFTRYVRSWHVQSEEERQRRAVLIRDIKSEKSIFAIWLKNAPETSIPPYEDQNNRRPPKCMSLIISKEKLDEKWPQWGHAMEIL